MSSNEERFILVPNPNNPAQMVRARALRHERIAGQDPEYRLEDGSIIRLIVDIETVSRPIDSATGRPAINPVTREPIYNVSWGVRVRTVYSQRVLDEAMGADNR